MEDCLFCKIVRGEIPYFKIWENEYCLAFLDIAKDIDGHILVIPKKHFSNFLDITPTELGKFIEGVQFVAKYLVEECGYDGVNLINASGESAEQSVFHLHFHIIPRKINDGAEVFPKFKGAVIDLAEMRKLLKIGDEYGQS